MQPQLTIAIPVYNRAGIVGRTLASIEAQSYRPLRVVLVDNGSTDHTYDVLCAWRDKVSAPDFEVTVLSEPEPGAAAARNAALAVTQTPWLMFFDSDDTMAPGHVERAMQAAAACPEADIVGWNTRLHFLDGSIAVKPFVESRLVYHGIMQGTMATQRYMARTALFVEAGGWTAGITTWDDIVIGTRMALIPGVKVVKAEGSPTVDVYQSEMSITGLSYHSKARESEQALKALADRLSSRREACVVPLKMSVLAALYRREGYRGDARRLYRRALAAAPSAVRRVLLRFAYAYTRVGLPGLATLLSPLYP